MEWFCKQFAAAICALLLTASALADFPWHGGHGERYDPPPHPRPADRHARAGCPQSIAPWAYFSYNNSYDGYYVGGGALYHGDPTWFPCDGVWGWDYFGRHLDRHVALGWWHGRKYQQGGGTYATDGPKVVHHE
jgi:hypothetical protein